MLGELSDHDASQPHSEGEKAGEKCYHLRKIQQGCHGIQELKSESQESLWCLLETSLT